MKKLYALKYMAKRRLVQKTVAFNILRELELLQELSHPFIVNLWFTFQVIFCILLEVINFRNITIKYFRMITIFTW